MAELKVSVCELLTGGGAGDAFKKLSNFSFKSVDFRRVENTISRHLPGQGGGGGEGRERAG